MLNRRQLLKNGALLTAFSNISTLNDLFAANTKMKFKVGACDWSLRKDSDIAAFYVAKQIGLEGIMVNMGSVKNNLHPR